MFAMRYGHLRIRHPQPWLLALALAALPAHGVAARLEPSFVPGLYETESRNSAFRNDSVRSRLCIASKDYDAFRRETMAQYAALPQFKAACRLSDTRDIADGFAFAMDCTGAKTIIAFHFSKDLVASTTRTLFVARPEYSSTILTLSRRTGDCPRQAPPAERL